MIQPQDVDQLALAFGGDMKKLLPKWEEIPEEFKNNFSGKWQKWQSAWFFSGLKALPKAKDGVDRDKALRHLKAIQGSWEPKHEHKAAAVAYLASQWFDKTEE